MPSGERRADRAAGVARRRLDPDIAEGSLAQHPAVGDAVERHATGQAQIIGVKLAPCRQRQARDHVLRHFLNRRREVHLALRQRRLGLTRRPAEQRVEALVGHRQAGHVVEIFGVEAERAVGLEVDQMVEDRAGVARLAIRREAHQLVLARVHLEAGVIGERRVEQAERVRKIDLPLRRQPVALAQPHRGRRPFAHTVEAQHGGALEGAGEKGRGGVGLMMLGEEQRRQRVELPAVERGEFALERRAQVELLLEPKRHRGQKRTEPARRIAQVGLHHALELHPGLVVEDDRVEVLEAQGQPSRGTRLAARWGKAASCFLRVKRSSCAAATISPSHTSAAALS